MRTVLNALCRLAETDCVYEEEGLKVDLLSYRVIVNGEDVMMTGREFKILLHFIRHPDRAFTRDQIIDAVWGVNMAITDRVIDSHINKIRNKLGSFKSRIEAVYGIGYRFVPGDSRFLR